MADTATISNDWSMTLASLTREARVPHTADTFFASLSSCTQTLLGHRLFTVLLYDRNAQRTQRYYTSDPANYPIGGTKPVVPGHWSSSLFEDAVPYVGHDADAIRDVFADHALIISLGCESVLNIPVATNGTVVGTLNLLHGPGWYQNANLDVAQIIAAVAAPTLMRVRPDPI
ncbi:MAG: GAF domain-containing protein [Chromatiales bacterium]|jgi:hypothetical protein|nr:GAF domain-containing protein [Chromatiales bacterium]